MEARKKAVTAQKKTTKRKMLTSDSCVPYTPLKFSTIEKRANELADRLESKFEELAHILLEYESYEVVLDEAERTLDLLRNLKENKSYFKLRIGAVAAFLPRNQPLYALTCFVLVPSFMASEVHFRIPHSMKHFFPKLLALLEIQDRFPNVVISHSQRAEFLKERSALRIDPDTRKTLPVTDAVIFTGTSAHADQLRMVFDQRTLFITNGSGHNPIVVGADADIAKAIEATLMLQLYNQGQDCAAPNAILVHQAVFQDFLRTLRDEIRAVRVGDYRDRQSRVGPISDPKDLVRVQDFLIDHRQWLDPTTPGIIRAYDAILEPTIINKSLKEGGNFGEIFAPAVFLQKYEDDADLARYFEDARYAQNAMYVTLYGSSDYVRNLIGRPIEGKVLHDARSFLHNNHLHAHGSERGTQPYGGNGYGASNLSINGQVISKATLPQRDIYEQVAKPLMDKKVLKARLQELSGATEIIHKDVQKLSRLKTQEGGGESEAGSISETTYVDLEGLRMDDRRFVKLDSEHVYQLLDRPNAEYIASLDFVDIETIRALHSLMLDETPVSLEEFKTLLYALAARQGDDDKEKRERQRRLFQHIYQLLLGKTSGPRLADFLLQIDRQKACALLDI